MIRCLCQDCKHNDGEGFCNDAGYFFPTISYGNMGLPICEDYDDTNTIYDEVEDGGTEPPKDEAPDGPYDLLYEEGGYNSNGV